NKRRIIVELSNEERLVSATLLGSVQIFTLIVGSRIVHDAALGVEDSFGELVGVVRLTKDVFNRGLLFLPELEERVVHELHAELGTGLNGRIDAEGFVFANQVGNAGRDDQNLISSAAAAADLGQEALGHDPDQGGGKLRANLVLQVAGKGVDEAVDRALGAVGVQSAKDHVAGFGCGNSRRDRFQVAHFADQDYVRVLTKGPADGLGEARHIDADLALIDRRFLMIVIELDRVFDRDDVMIDVLIDVVHQAGQRRAFARPGWSRDQEQTAGPQHQLHAHVRQAELLGREHVVGNLPQHHRDKAALLE